MAFIRDILRLRKKVLKQNEVHMLDVPNYPEFTVQRLYEMFAKDTHVMMYLPDPAAQSRPADRTWAYTVVCSLRPEYMQQFWVGPGNVESVMSSSVRTTSGLR